MGSVDPDKGLRFRIHRVLCDKATSDPFCVIDTKHKRRTAPASSDIACVVAHAEAKGQPCPEYGTEIERIQYLGRPCYFCPQCQT